MVGLGCSPVVLFALCFACAVPPSIPAEVLLPVVTFAYLLLFIAFMMSFKVASAATMPVGEKTEAVSLTQSVTRSLKATATVTMAAMERFLTIASGLDPYAGAKNNDEATSDDEEQEDESKDANKYERRSLDEDWDSDDGDDAFHPIRSALGFFDGD